MDSFSSEGAPVVLKERRRVFTNSHFNIYSDHIAGGTLEVQDYLVVAPHTRPDDFLAGVVVVPVRGDSILLLKRYRHPVGRHVWELPRGFVDAGEEPSAAAIRELAEETGLQCSEGMMISLGTFLPDPGVLRAEVALFAAVDCRPGAGRLDDEVGLTMSDWFSRDALSRMLQSGALQEGSSCIALYRYLAALEHGSLG